MNKKKLLFFAADDFYFCSHRFDLAKAAQNQGYEIYVLTKVHHHADIITSSGFNLIPFNFDRKGIDPIIESSVIYKIKKIYKEIQPDIIHHIALKPILYGTIASLFLKKRPKIINAFTGMGHLFTTTQFHMRSLASLVMILYRAIFKRSKSHIIVQNKDDYQLFLKKKLITEKQLHLIRGSGVDLHLYSFSPEPPKSIAEPVIALFVARMLKDKGLLELIEAAKLLQQENIQLQIQLIGKPDPHNPTSVTEEDIQEWVDQGLVIWLGHQNNIQEFWKKAHIAVLPSYREGLPKSLLEAASSGRPIITSDVPGCREICIHGHNGILVPAKDPIALKEALKTLALDSELRQKMGKESRKLVEDHFSIDSIVEQTLALYAMDDEQIDSSKSTQLCA
jgi:glycosyltransferase involved in cell wall biosynthesis